MWSIPVKIKVRICDLYLFPDVWKSKTTNLRESVNQIEHQVAGKWHFLIFCLPMVFKPNQQEYCSNTAYIAAGRGQRPIFAPKLKFEYAIYTCFLTFGNQKLPTFGVQWIKWSIRWQENYIFQVFVPLWFSSQISRNTAGLLHILLQSVVSDQFLPQN